MGDYPVAYSLAEEKFSKLEVCNKIKLSEGFVEVDE